MFHRHPSFGLPYSYRTTPGVRGVLLVRSLEEYDEITNLQAHNGVDKVGVVGALGAQMQTVYFYDSNLRRSELLVSSPCPRLQRTGPRVPVGLDVLWT